jgi:hypothetical protein
MSGCFALEQLLFEARRDPALARSLRERPVAVACARGVDPNAAQALAEGAVDRLLALGVNPLLLYLSMIEMGMSREDYYARLGQASGVGR